MGIGLIVEVMDRAPDGLTSGERLVLLVIAEWANDSTRVARQTQNWTLYTICRRAGIKRSGLKSVLQGLARKGLEVRVPLAVKDGRPVYAHEGKSMTFQVPTMPERGGQDVPSERGGHGIPTDQEGMPQHPRGVAVASKRGGHSHPHPLSSPQDPSSLSAREADSTDNVGAEHHERDSDLPQEQPQDPIAAILGRHNVTGDNVDQVRGYVDSLPGGIKGPGWYRTCDRAGDLAGHIAGALAEPPEPARTPKCNDCDPARLVYVRSPTGKVGMRRCPTCHPGREPLEPGAEVIGATDEPSQSSPIVKRPKRNPNSPCGRWNCRDGKLTLGINTIDCPSCPTPAMATPKESA